LIPGNLLLIPFVNAKIVTTMAHFPSSAVS
jgi:hypothetical protein